MATKYQFTAKERNQAHVALHSYALGIGVEGAQEVISNLVPNPYERAFSLATQLYCPPGEWESIRLDLSNHDLHIIAESFRNLDKDKMRAFREPAEPLTNNETAYGENWGEKRKDAFSKHGEKCDSCGMSRSEHKQEYGVDLHIHHIIPISDFDSPSEANRVENLQPLCASCHREVEPT